MPLSEDQPSGVDQGADSALPSEALVEQANSLLRDMAGVGLDANASLAVQLLAGMSANSPSSAAPWSAERRYRALVEKIPAVTFMAGLDAAVHELYVSPQIEALLGFSQEQWLSDPFLWYRQLHPEDRARWGEEFARTCATGVQFKSEYRLIARDGRVVWIHGECQVVRDEAGRPLFLQGIAFDITESKRAEELLRRAHDELDIRVRERTAELARANEALRAEIAERKLIEAELVRAKEAAESANKAKDQFLAVLSHELRTPLTPVLGAVEILEEQPDLTPDAREAMQMVRRNVELEARLIDDLLDLTRIARGKLQLRQEAADVHESLHHAISICKAEIETKRQSLELELGATARIVWADRTRLQQMLWNLLNNAVKFTPVHGRITVRSWNDPQGRIVIQVIDTGIGIDAKVLPRLFSAFEQGEQTMNRRFGGLGLGLMITRWLAETHGGQITAASAGPQMGSTFTLTLNTIAAMTESASLSHRPHDFAPPTARARSDRRILLVEDNEDTLRMIARMLRSLGYDVQTATGVQAALSLAEKETFSLLVSDIGLPDGSGWDIMNQLRQRQSLRGIALSGFGMDDDMRRSREAGFDRHLVKPINFAILESAISQVLQ